MLSHALLSYLQTFSLRLSLVWGSSRHSSRASAAVQICHPAEKLQMHHGSLPGVQSSASGTPVYTQGLPSLYTGTV